MSTKIQSLLIPSINRTGKQKQIMISLIGNILVSYFQDKKNIDIRKYLISIKLCGKVIIIKTHTPILNSEIICTKKEILSEIQSKISSIGFKMEGFDLKTI